MTIELTTEVEQLAQRLADKTGTTPEKAIKEAVEERARAVGVNIETRRGEIDEAAVYVIIERAAARPILDHRSDDEILGYNEYGVPE